MKTSYHKGIILTMFFRRQPEVEKVYTGIGGTPESTKLRELYPKKPDYSTEPKDAVGQPAFDIQSDAVIAVSLIVDGRQKFGVAYRKIHVGTLREPRVSKLSQSYDLRIAQSALGLAQSKLGRDNVATKTVVFR